MIAAYLNVEAYAEFHRWLGRGDGARSRCGTRGRAGDRKGALEVIPDEVTDALVLHGSFASCREQVLAYVEAGITIPAIAIVPFGVELARRRPRPRARALRAPWSSATSPSPRSPAACATASGPRASDDRGALDGDRGAQRRGQRLRRARPRARSSSRPTPSTRCVASGADPGPLAGVPIGVKDLEDAAGFPTTHGSPLEADAAPAVRDSHLVERLRRAGCVVVGKTNTPEYGWTACTTNARLRLHAQPLGPRALRRRLLGRLGAPRSPRAWCRSRRAPTAAARSGSPRRCCGLSGLKPSFGRVPAGGPTPPGWLHALVQGPDGPAHRRRRPRARRGRRPRAGRPRARCRAPRPRWLDAVVDPELPTRVGWSPTLGYATGRRRGAGASASARSSALETLGVEVVEVADVFDADPVRRVARRRRGVPRARPRRAAATTPATASCTPSCARSPSTARPVTGVQARRGPRRVPPAEPRAWSSSSDDVRLLVTPTTAAVAPHERDGVAGHGQRRARRRVGPLHLPVQHDAEPRRDGVRGAHRRRAARRPPARRPPARRRCSCCAAPRRSRRAIGFDARPPMLGAPAAERRRRSPR